MFSWIVFLCKNASTIDNLYFLCLCWEWTFNDKKNVPYAVHQQTLLNTLMSRLCIDTPSIYELCLALHPSAREAATGTMKPRSGQLMPKNSKEETCGMPTNTGARRWAVYTGPSYVMAAVRGYNLIVRPGETCALIF